MKKIILLLAILVCCVFNCLAQEQIEQEEYDIYKILLGNINQSVIFKFTNNQDLNYVFKSSFHKSELSLIQSETRKNYNKRNKSSFEIQENFSNQSNIKLVTNEDVRPFIEKSKEDELAAENAFNEKYGSRTVISLSRIGFNKSKNQALIGVSYNTGLCGTCSESYLIILSKQAGQWIIKKKILTEIS